MQPVNDKADDDDPDKWEVPKSAEYFPELDALISEIETRLESGKVVSRTERAAREVYGTIGHVECNNLVQFWGSGYDPLQAIESFRIVGEHDVADALFSSRWLRGIVARGTDSEGAYFLTPEEEEMLDENETLVYSRFIGVPTRLLARLQSSTTRYNRPNNPMDRSGGSAAS